VQVFVRGMEQFYPAVSLKQLEILSSVAEAIGKLAPHCSSELEPWRNTEADCRVTIHAGRYAKSFEDAINDWFEFGDLFAFAGMLCMLPLMIVTIDRNGMPRNLKLILHTGSGTKEWDEPEDKIWDFVYLCHHRLWVECSARSAKQLEKFRETVSKPLLLEEDS